MWVIASLYSLVAFSRRSASRVDVGFFIAATLSFCFVFFIATKSTQLQVGNDKPQYIEYMREFQQGGFIDAIENQPEIVSFGVIYAASSLHGVSNLSFALIFAASFFVLLLALKRIMHDSVPAAICLILSSFVLYTAYGNVIRQSIAISFLVLALASGGKKRVALLLVTSLAHLSTLAFLPFFLFKKTKLYIQSNPSSAIVIAAAFFLLGKVSSLLLTKVSKYSEYLEVKSEIYSAWESYDNSKSVAMATILFLACLLTTRRIKALKPSAAFQGSLQTLNELWLFSNYIFCILMLSVSYTKIFDRFYIYYYVIAMIYLVLFFRSRKSFALRAASAAAIILYSTFYLIKNIIFYQEFYCGEPGSFLLDSIFAMLSCLGD